MGESNSVDRRSWRWVACCAAYLLLAQVEESALADCQTPGSGITYADGSFELYLDNDGDGCVDDIDYFDGPSETWYYSVGQGEDPGWNDPAYSCVTCSGGNCLQIGPPGSGYSSQCSDGGQPVCEYGGSWPNCDPPPSCDCGGTYPHCDDCPDCPHGGTYPDCNDPPPACECGGTYPDCDPCPDCPCGTETDGSCTPNCSETCQCGGEYPDCTECGPDPPPCSCDTCDADCDENHLDWPRCTPCCSAEECEEDEGDDPWDCEDCDCIDLVKDQFAIIWDELKTGFLPTAPTINGQPVEYVIKYRLPAREGATHSEFRVSSDGEILTTNGSPSVGGINTELENGISTVRAVFLYMSVFGWAFLAVNWVRQS